MAAKVRALRAFGYGGKQRCIGEVFDRMYLVNDERLLSEQFHYLKPVESNDMRDVVRCDKCGREFISEHFYAAHIRDMHKPEAPSPPVVPLEEEYPGGLVIDGRSGRMRPGRV